MAGLEPVKSSIVVLTQRITRLFLDWSVYQLLETFANDHPWFQADVGVRTLSIPTH